MLLPSHLGEIVHPEKNLELKVVIREKILSNGTDLLHCKQREYKFAYKTGILNHEKKSKVSEKPRKS